VAPAKNAARNSSSVLLRQLGLFSATALVVSNMVGTGIFTTTGFLAADLGRPTMVLGIWLAGAAIALAGALCYAELGINLPRSGGEYLYLTRAYGPTWGFMSGWVSFIAGFSAPIAAAALAFSDYVGYFFPEVKQESGIVLGQGAFQVHLGGAQLVAGALILVFTLLNFFGVRQVARVQNALTAIKILVLAAFIVAGFVVGTGDWDHFSQSAARTSATPVAAQFAFSLVFIYVGYSGWNAATYVAEELRDPERTLPLALTLGTAFVAALYLALNICFIYAVPLQEMKGILAVGSLAATHLFGPQIAGVFSALMALALLATVNAMVTIGPRVYYAMAKNGAFFAGAAKVHPRWHTPINAIIAQGACAMLMTVTRFTDLFFFIGITLNFFAVMSVSSLFIFRRRPDWRKLRAVSFMFPLIPLFFIVAGLCVTLFGVLLNPAWSTVAIATVATGALIYRFRLRSSTPARPPL
jgi:APA family basic amino acid/polyamine antiporter